MPEIDDILLQEIQSLNEKLLIATRIIKFYCPDLNKSDFLHSLGTCDYQEYIEEVLSEGERK